MLAPRAKRPKTDWPFFTATDQGPSGEWQAGVDLAYETQAGRTVPSRRRHVGPLRVLKGYRQSGDDCWEQVLVHPPGGIAGRDRLNIQVQTGQQTRVLMTTPGATKWYRSANAERHDQRDGKSIPAQQNVKLSINDESGFEWLPLENIFYSGTIARLETKIEVAPKAALIAGEVYCLGRPASQAPFERGRIEMHTRLTRVGRPVFIERARLDGGSRALFAPAGLNGQPCFGTLIVMPAVSSRNQATDPDPQAWLAQLRDTTRHEMSKQMIHGEVGITVLPQVLVVRWRGPSAEAGWGALRTAWQVLREPVLGRAVQAPRIWAC
ncbi:MAG: urease accessory protein UreD [Burkholderiaceae bacterium]